MSAVPSSPAEVESLLRDFPDPETGRPMGQLGMIAEVQPAGSRLALTLALPTHSAPLWNDVREAVTQKLKARFPGLTQVEIKIVPHLRPIEKLGQIGLTAKSVIAVGSGKGGVGKSTVAASIALGLKKAGCVVGLLDTDVYGPSIPHLLGLSGRPEVDNGKIVPRMKDGMPVMSMGFLVPPEQAVVWRGPMLHGAITQMLRDTLWGDLDYLILDLPPGTGDIALTLSQMLPLTGAVVVCTPQEVALLDAVKAIAMFRTVKIPVLGMVENMSGFLCPSCHKSYDIFGSGGARKRAGELNVPFLGEIPLHMAIRVNGDAGDMGQNFTDPILAPYLDRICYQLVKLLSDQSQAQPKLPSLTVL